MRGCMVSLRHDCLNHNIIRLQNSQHVSRQISLGLIRHSRISHSGDVELFKSQHPRAELRTVPDGRSKGLRKPKRGIGINGLVQAQMTQDGRHLDSHQTATAVKDPRRESTIRAPRADIARAVTPGAGPISDPGTGSKETGRVTGRQILQDISKAQR